MKIRYIILMLIKSIFTKDVFIFVSIEILYHPALIPLFGVGAV